MKICLFLSDEFSFLDYLEKDIDCVVVNSNQKPNTEKPILFFNLVKHDEVVEQKIIEFLKQHQIDLLVLSNYKFLIKQKLIDEYNDKIISVHPSLLPLFPGKISKVYKEVLDRGVKVTGCTLHYVNKGMDTGKIILQEPVRIENDTIESLHKKMIEAEKQVLKQGIELLQQQSKSNH